MPASLVYMICAPKFSDLALNAPKVKPQGTCEIHGVFQCIDIDKAKEATLAFVGRNGLKDVENLMEFIGLWHLTAVNWNAQRIKSAFAQVDAYNGAAGFAGAYYNCRQLPDEQWRKIWDDITETIPNFV